ncbi:transcription factor WhiB family protein [Mycobacterium kansasii]|uniref:Transcription factor WhiB family protein n=1 Tax=Mycobacterium kansasii TaxID=1768 RepID=A0A1V3WGH6_MYCKA|nr:transcription factor WhiB family protein [Mycobacterium kansasii]
MRKKGQPLEVIADYLQVSTRSVLRYLALPCPEPPASSDDVELGSFVMEGACAAFPEVDWLSDNPVMEAEAKTICQYCPVLDKCRSYGLNKGRDQHGVLGAMTMAERQRQWHRQQQRTTQRPGVVARVQGAA